MLADTQNNSLIIDDRTSGSLNSNLGTKWRLVTDNVMGGLSSGKVTLDNIKDKNCIRMRGDVSTKNNGGFVQIALPYASGYYQGHHKSTGMLSSASKTNPWNSVSTRAN